MILGQLRMGEHHMTSAPLSPDNPLCYVHLWCRFYNILYLNNKQKIGKNWNYISHLSNNIHFGIFTQLAQNSIWRGKSCSMLHHHPPRPEQQHSSEIQRRLCAVTCGFCQLPQLHTVKNETASQHIIHQNVYIGWHSQKTMGVTQNTRISYQGLHIYAHAPYDRN